MRTSFHHQPEPQHPKFFSYPQAAGRLPYLWGAIAATSATKEVRSIEHKPGIAADREQDRGDQECHHDAVELRSEVAMAADNSRDDGR